MGDEGSDGGSRDEGDLAVRLLACAPETVFVVTAEGAITWVGGDVERLSGYRPDEIVGTNILDHVVVDWNPWALESVGVAVSSPPGLRRPMLFKIVRKDGSTVIAECTANPQMDDPVVGGLAVYARRWDERHLLDLVMEGLAANGPLTEVLELLVEVLGAETLEADGAVLYDRVDDRFARGVFAGAVPAPLAGARRLPGAPWEEAARTGLPVCTPVAELPPALAGPASEAGYAWCWSWPVVVDGQVEACLVLWRRADEAADHTCSMRIENLARITSLVLERHRSASALEHAAFHDALTGLCNRSRFFERLTRALDEPSPGSVVGVLYVDLDGFKPVNDRFGHGAGDEVLRTVARRLAAAVRAEDLVARMGGDEFAILCPGTDTAGLEVLAERVTRVVGEPIGLGVGTVSVGASVGVASSPPGACSVDGLVDAADQALYSAKAAAGGAWRLAGDGPGSAR